MATNTIFPAFLILLLVFGFVFLFGCLQSQPEASPSGGQPGPSGQQPGGFNRSFGGRNFNGSRDFNGTRGFNGTGFNRTGGSNGNFSNMTDEQRQALQQQRLQQALDACSGKVAGAACELTSPRGIISGTCFANPQGSLACEFARPSGMPPFGGQGAQQG